MEFRSPGEMNRRILKAPQGLGCDDPVLQDTSLLFAGDRGASWMCLQFTWEDPEKPDGGLAAGPHIVAYSPKLGSFGSEEEDTI